jgi:steroid 5-alpha reductase family enzyme
MQAHRILAAPTPSAGPGVATKKTGSPRTASSVVVVDGKYFLPVGGLFAWTSNPHYFAELLFYLALCLLAELTNLSLWYVCLSPSVHQFISSSVHQFIA